MDAYFAILALSLNVYIFQSQAKPQSIPPSLVLNINNQRGIIHESTNPFDSTPKSNQGHMLPPSSPLSNTDQSAEDHPDSNNKGVENSTPMSDALETEDGTANSPKPIVGYSSVATSRGLCPLNSRITIGGCRKIEYESPRPSWESRFPSLFNWGR